MHCRFSGHQDGEKPVEKLPPQQIVQAAVVLVVFMVVYAGLPDQRRPGNQAGHFPLSGVWQGEDVHIEKIFDVHAFRQL